MQSMLAAGVACGLTKCFQLVEAAAPGGGRVHLLERHDLGTQLPQQPGRFGHVVLQPLAALQQLVGAIFAAVGQIQGEHPQRRIGKGTRPSMRLTAWLP